MARSYDIMRSSTISQTDFMASSYDMKASENGDISGLKSDQPKMKKRVSFAAYDSL